MAKRPKPTVLHQLHGTYEPGRHGARSDSIIPACDQITAPMGLSAKAKQHWQVVAEQLNTVGVLSNMDVDALALYCEQWAIWQAANAQLHTHGMLVKHPKFETPMESPFLKISLKAADMMRKLLTEFGMTPCARVHFLKPNTPKTPSTKKGTLAAWVTNKTS